ncbi:DUF4214 domain-containing protein [Aquihabitans sp. McL0605]|uniref:DUF4214 domain-containing protein n=1 Tax=Aquihabitans sp. McL0605 TaxID=3415671 RepID=UPI003CEEA19C
MVQRQRGWRSFVVSGAVVASVAAVLSLPIGPAGARSGRPASPAKAAVVAPSGALTAQPANATWARQILARYAGTKSTADIVALATALGKTSNPSVPIRAAALKKAQVDKRVAELFEQVLERPTDPTGLDYWSGRIRAGSVSYENLLITLSTSNEAWRKAGSTPDGYIDWTYSHLLGRAADAPGKAYWQARLGDASARELFVRSFIRSSERARQLVRADFVRYLDRDADASGLAHWISQYTAGKVGELDLAVALLASSESRNAGCGYDPTYCLLPFPSSRQTVKDASTVTGVRVALKPEWMPANASGKHIDPVEWNRNDGFSPGQAIVVRVPGIDVAKTGLAGQTDIGASLDDDAPIAIIDQKTGERQPYFAELDSNVPAGSPDQVLYVRPAIDYKAGHTYVVGMTHMKDASGAEIPAPAKFDRLRDKILEADPDAPTGPGTGDAVETTFGFAALAHHADMLPQDLYLEWQFTVASTESTTGRMLHIRDDALASLDGHAPAFTVTSVTANPTEGVAKRVIGTYQVPLYLTGDGSAGQAFNTGPDGLPKRNGSYTARFDCELPTLTGGQKARAVIYGHGLFGDYGEVQSGPQRAMVRDHDMAYCATDWVGMSDQDVGNALTILTDMSTFRTLSDRSQQGILNTVVLGRLMLAPDGLTSNAAFKTAGQPVLDTSDLFYDGNSQGGVIGGAFIAVSPDISAGVLGVAGMNYSTLLERSVDFDPFFSVMKNTYLRATDRVLGLQLIQMLWDRGETNGYAAHLTDDPLPGSGANRVLIHVALGDHQVAPLTAEIEARTAGMAIHRPVYGDGRSADVDPGWDLPSIDYPSSGSGLVVWDSGATLAPLANVPPRVGEDPHQDPRSSSVAQGQKDAFLRTGGTITDVCSAAPCTAPQS